ncbi:MAG: hypothetical protein K2Q12_00910 [Rickettsiales bacterium]|nr:hypothetical protein [Rickettsiales bacterium]
MTIDLIPFQPMHLMAMEGTELEIEQRGLMLAALDKANVLHAFTLTEEGYIIGSGGVCGLRDGVAEAWLVLTPRFYRRTITSIRRIVDFLALYQCQFTRLQALVHTNDGRAYDFMIWLGFECEGRLRKYAMGKDMYMFSWVNT